MDTLIGLTVKCFYNDTDNSVSYIEGRVLSQSELFLEIKDNKNGKAVLLPHDKIVRIEKGAIQ